jgi:hypothetical protein
LTGGSASYSTSTSSTASSATAALSATTAATYSPAYRTSPSASAGWANSSGISAISWMGTVGRSLAVKTATTPGWIAAGVVSTCTMRARATGDVTNVSTSAPAACRSAVKCAEPSSSSSVTARSVIAGDVTVRGMRVRLAPRER